MDYVNGLNEFRRLGVSDKIVALPKPLKKTSLYAVFSRNTVEKDFADKFTAELNTEFHKYAASKDWKK
jgi:hypothetical protein